MKKILRNIIIHEVNSFFGLQKNKNNSDYLILKSSKYFDKKWYLKINNDVKISGIDPIDHYLNYGWKEGRNPSNKFNTNEYLKLNVDVANADINPLLHYEKYGKYENRKIGKSIKQNSDIFLIKKSKYFNRRYYLSTYKDVKKNKIDPALHYLEIGWKEGKNPSKYFNTNEYLELNKDIAAAGINPLLHYENNGKRENRLFNKKKIDIYKKKSEPFRDVAKKVTVIIPNYNYEKFIIERIDSILNQTYPIHELIILDDCSTDNSVQVIENKIKDIKDINVKFIKNTVNTGVPFNQWLKGYNEVSGDYFWIAEADDSCEPTFLETVMKGFDDAEVVLSYTDSARIDENNILIAKNSKDLYNITGSKHWDKPYINDGIDEISNYLSIITTIVNVSSVVWKNGDYQEIFEKAKQFKVAGDWYIYYRLLENGKIAFSNQSLNYYRKHSKSACTVIKADIEYKEIEEIQEEISQKYHLSMDIYKAQRKRRNCMDSLVSKNVRKKRIAWVIPCPGKGSGGTRTIIQNVNALIRHGYECDFYIENGQGFPESMIAEMIEKFYEKTAANVYLGKHLAIEYDLIFATGWQTIDFVKDANVAKKAYFIQDFEPCFFPMGDQYIETENSYKLGFMPVTIGKWLSYKMINEYGNNSRYFDFCVDLNAYKPIDSVKKEKAICFVYQPEKTRRCHSLAMKALKKVKTQRPDIKIYFYGSDEKAKVDFEVEQLGIISIEECNKLYNKCQVGFCISASNPSRIPFEMMAAGLPPVEIYRENNLYDFPENAIRLAEPSEGSLAMAIVDLFDNDEKRNQLSLAGVEYMKQFPIEKGFEQFVSSVDEMFTDSYGAKIVINRMYNKSI